MSKVNPDNIFMITSKQRISIGTLESHKNHTYLANSGYFRCEFGKTTSLPRLWPCNQAMGVASFNIQSPTSGYVFINYCKVWFVFLELCFSDWFKGETNKTQAFLFGVLAMSMYFSGSKAQPEPSPSLWSRKVREGSC